VTFCTRINRWTIFQKALSGEEDKMLSMPKLKSLGSGAILLYATFVFGQVPSPSLRMPSSETEAADQAKGISQMELPPENLVYEALQDARKSTEYYRSISDSLSKAAAASETSKKGLSDQLLSLQSSAKNCKRMDVGALKQQLATAGGLPGFEYEIEAGIGGAENPFADFVNAKKSITSLANAQFCAELGKPETLKNLQAKFNAGADKSKQMAIDQVKWADMLAKAWGERVQKLSEKTKPALRVTDKLTYLVLLLGLFGCGFLLLVKVFSPDIQLELVASGQIIQFPTVVILLVVLVILGLSEKIADTTLSALLGGIAGYVLSQGVGRATAREAERRAAGHGQLPGLVSGRQQQ
jgi:hypothetical protein